MDVTAMLIFSTFVTSLFIREAYSLNRTLPNTCTQDELDVCPPNNPLIPCCLLPEEFYVCDKPVIVINHSNRNDTIDGCSSFEFGYFEDVENTTVKCDALMGVDCCGLNGTKSFKKRNVPCIRYNAYFFPTMVLFSVFLGFCGIDRLCMGYCCVGLAKMFTLGGLGVWWLVDILLLLSGNLQPYDNYVWERFY